MKKLGIIAWCLLCYNCILSQKTFYKHFTVEEGLPSNQIYTSFQDSKGYMWFGTDAGLVRYNGYEFKVYNSANSGLCNDLVFEMYEVGETLVLQGHEALSLMNLSTYEITCIVGNGIENNEDAGYTPANFSSVFFDLKDSVVYCKSSLNDEILQVSVKEQKVTYLRNIANIKILSFCKRKDSVGLILNGKMIHIPYIFNFNLGSVKSKYARVKDGYFVYFRNLLIKIDTNERITFTKQFEQSIVSIFPHNDVVYICLDQDDRVLKLAGNEVTVISGLSGFKFTTSICIDHEGGYWVTTLENGVYYLPSLQLKTLLDGYVVKDMIVQDSNLIVATATARIYRSVQDSLELIRDFDAEIRSLTKDRNGTVLSCVQRLKSIDSQSFTRGSFDVRTGVRKFDKVGRKIFFSKQNDAYAIYSNGVLKLLNDSEHIRSENKSNFDRSTYDYHTRNDTVFLATESGVWYFIPPSFDFYQAKFPIMDKEVRALMYYNDYWLFSVLNRGLYVFGKDTSFVINKSSGLPVNNIYHMYNDGDSVLWLASNAGVVKLTNIKYPKISTIINTSDGLASNKIFKILRKDDIVYAATAKGLSYFSPNFDPIEPKPIFYLDSVKINGKKSTLSVLSDISHDQNLLRFDFHALSYKMPGKILYQYRIDHDYDTTWIETSNRFVIFSALKPGDYQIEFRACEPGHHNFSNVEYVSVSIAPPVWQRWWFVLFIFGLLLLVVLLIFRMRLTVLRRRQDLLEELNLVKQESLSSQMNPHFIFNSLNSIQRYILQNDRKTSNKYLTKFSRLMRQVLDNSRHQLVSLADELAALELYIELEELRFKGKMTYKIVRNADINGLVIPPLLIQPFVENAIWHGLMNKEEPGHLLIEINRKDMFYTVTIQDDGIGRKKASEINLEKRKKYKSAGMDITSKRIELANKLYKGKLSVEFIDLYGSEGHPEGTKVLVMVPINLK